MSLKYNWNFYNLEVDSSKENTVKSVRYQLSVTDDTDDVTVYIDHMTGGLVTLLEPTEGAPFVKMEDITPEILEGWVTDTLGVALPKMVEEAFTIERGKVKSVSLPWMVAPVEVIKEAVEAPVVGPSDVATDAGSTSTPDV